MLKSLLAVSSLLLSLSPIAFAGRYNATPIDLSRDFHDQQINMLGDDMYGVRYADILIADLADAQFMVSIAPAGAWNNPKAKGSCRVAGLMKRGAQLLIRVEADVEYDDGSACVLLVRYSNGRSARVTLYKTGT